MNGEIITQAYQRIRMRLKRPGPPDDDADDALQEAFCRIWSKRENVKGESHAEGLLAVAVRNIRIDRRRREAVHPWVEIDEADGVAPDRDESDFREVYDRVDAIVEKSLSDRDRQILYLRDRDGWDFDEIGNRFGLTESNVRMIVSRARKTIRELYLKHSDNG